MKVLILAAGYGTRLYPIITDTPKPLLPVADKPIINHLLEKIKSLPGLAEVIVVTNNKFYSHFLKWADENNNFPARITIVNDGTLSPDDRLGSVGDIHFVFKNHPVNDDLLILGGDNLFDYGLGEFISFAGKKKPQATIGLYDIGNLAEATKFGVVSIDGDGKVTSFEEKPETPKSSLIAMCLYYFPVNSLGLVSEYIQETKKTDKAGEYIRWLGQKKGIFGFKFEGKWYDIGSIESYYDAQEKFKK